MLRLADMFAAAREPVGAFLGADADGCAFVANATAGVNTVLASLSLEPGDRLVCTSHAYGAVRNAMAAACERSGADLVEVPIDLPLPDDDTIVAAVAAALDPRVRLVMIEHVTSLTAAIIPIRRVVEACRAAGVPVMVDAAHGPGMVPTDVCGVGADYWTGNLHKWVCAPKGSAVLWVAPEHRERTHPLVTSHGRGQGFRAEFDWTGTHDPTPFLAAPAALDFMGALGWERVMAHNHALAALGRETVAAALGTPQLVDDARFGSMSLVALPNGWVTGAEGALAFEAVLRDRHRVEVPVIWWDRAFLRLSAQVYNAPADYGRLASVLPSAARTVRT
jgi:isopenicillin-N epimerase